MSYSLEHLCVDQTAAKTPASHIFHSAGIRVSVLADTVFRIEIDPTESFVDAASLAIWNRIPNTKVCEKIAGKGDGFTIKTAMLSLTYKPGLNEMGYPDFKIETLEGQALWQMGQVAARNLGGTFRTLDDKNGPVLLEKGLITRDGWTLVEDSKQPVFDEKGWVTERSSNEIDIYFLYYGTNYRKCLQDFFRLSGPSSMPPRWVLGNWWSRYHEYTQSELTGVIEEFKAQEIPLSTCVIDMDWHTIVTESGRRGWTGYTWNEELFPDVQVMLDKFRKELGLRVSLNLHPHEGVWPQEEAYKDFCDLIGKDAKSLEPIAFDITDKQFVEAYFRFLHHPLEEMGIDLWWMDWQQGKKTKIKNLDPLWMLNHFHYQDLGRNQNRRPLQFSRWAGYGGQRYAIQFSGDTVVSWESLNFQPYCTATASNAGCYWWSHDIGGHFQGVEDPDLYIRWVQFGIFSPVSRLHSSKGQFRGREPWVKGKDSLEIGRDFLQLRHALIPWLYTLAFQSYATGEPLLKPMYFDYPDEEAAYNCPGQYVLGDSMIVAPITTPTDLDTKLSRQVVWLPEGNWIHFFTGESIAGNRWHVDYCNMESMPVFVKAGSIVPMSPKTGWGGLNTSDTLTLHIYAGENGEFTLYDDEGEGQDFRQGRSTFTKLSQSLNKNELSIQIDAAKGDLSVLPEKRKFKLLIHGVSQLDSLKLFCNGKETASTAHQIEIEYQEFNETVTLTLPECNVGDSQKVIISSKHELISKRNRTFEKCMKWLPNFRIAYALKTHVEFSLRDKLSPEKMLTPLGFCVPPSVLRCLSELFTDSGIHLITCKADEHLVIAWNNNSSGNIRYCYAGDTSPWLVQHQVQGWVKHSTLRSQNSKGIQHVVSTQGPWSAALYLESLVVGKVGGSGLPTHFGA